MSPASQAFYREFKSLGMTDSEAQTIARFDQNIASNMNSLKNDGRDSCSDQDMLFFI